MRTSISVTVLYILSAALAIRINYTLRSIYIFELKITIIELEYQDYNVLHLGT